MSSIGPYTFIIAASLIVLLSFLFSTVAKKTNIPAVLMLIALGVGVQYLLKYVGVGKSNFFPFLEVLGIVGLIMIVLEAALELELKKEKAGMILNSLVVALLGLAVSMVSAAAIIYYTVDGMDWWLAMLYATPLSILSSAIIIPSVGNLSEHKKEFHIYESTFSDILGIMLFYFVLAVIMNGNGAEAGGSHGNPVAEFFIGLAVTVLVAIVASYVLLIIFQHIKGGAKLFLLIAMLLLLYSVGKIMHLSPLIIILVFGLVVSNSGLFFKGILKRFLHHEKFTELEKGLHVVTLETAFVVRTFFFVIFGATIALSSLVNLDVLVISVLILASIYLIRWILLRIFIGKDLKPQLWIAPRGLITVLLFYAIPSELVNKSFESGILLFIIIATGLVMTAGMIWSNKHKDTEGIEALKKDFPFDNEPLPKIDKLD